MYRILNIIVPIATWLVWMIFIFNNNDILKFFLGAGIGWTTSTLVLKSYFDRN